MPCIMQNAMCREDKDDPAQSLPSTYSVKSKSLKEGVITRSNTAERSNLRRDSIELSSMKAIGEPIEQFQ